MRGWGGRVVACWSLLGLAACAGAAPAGAPDTTVVASEAAAGSEHAVVAQAQAAPASAPVDYAAVVAAPDRSEEDRALDAGRKPVETLAFMGVEPGMRVAEIAAGGGYTAELLARTVGPSGEVYGVNSPFLLQRFAEAPWSARLSKDVMKPVVRLDRALDDPFPADLGDLDLVVDVLFYHDTFWMEMDRDAMNRAIFAALRPGGAYVVIDHSSRDPMADGEVETLHRVGEQRVREEIERAGFVLAESAEFLRNPADERDWSASPRFAGERRGQSDRFVLKFIKPTAAP